jgi:serine protease Do
MHPGWRTRWKDLGLVAAGAALASVATCARPPSGGDDPDAPRILFNASPAFARAADGVATLPDIAEAVVPSVVNISAMRAGRPGDEDDVPRNPMLDDPMFREFFGPESPLETPRDRETRSLGSGVIVGADGLILTSAHVIDGARQVEVALSDGRELDGKVVGVDAESDLALVRLPGKPKNLVPLRFGDSTRMRLGDVVLAIGNPFGVGQTVTMGIVSATGRSRVGIVDYEDFIQTDAAINPGNSGGALVNMRGELVGVNTAILSRSGGYQGIGFAVPAAMADPIMKSLIAHGKVTRGWLGATIQEIDRTLGTALGIEAHRGVLIADVTQGGPAARAGIRRGDVITRIDGTPITSSARFRNKIAFLAPGTAIQLEVMRNKQARAVRIALGNLRDDPERESQARPAAASDRRPSRADLLAGLGVAELGPAARRRLSLPRSLTGGVLVAAVQPDSPAERVGLAVNDIILELDRRRVSSAADFRRRVRDAGDAVVVLVYRGGTTLYLAARR